MDRVIPFFQPIINASTAEVVGHEALARLQSADGQVSSAGHLLFSPSRTRSERLNTDRSLRRLALERFADAGQPGYLTINISPEWIDHTDGDDPYTVDLIKDLGIDPERVVIEVIETNADAGRLKDAVECYRNFGLKIAIDDFGAGHSSFDRVINLQPDVIKLDMALFHKALEMGGKAEHLIDSICFLAERLGSNILAEGVENLEGFSYSQKFGSQLLQGYLFSPAQADFTATLAFDEHITQLRHSYVDAETQSLAKKRIIRRVLDQQLLQLMENTRTTADLNIAALGVLTHPDFYKLYICNHVGDQVTADYIINNGAWHEQESARNTNLSCRPYFCQLQSAVQFKEHKIVTCAPYHDLHTKRLIETKACKLDDGLTLFIDVAYRR